MAECSLVRPHTGGSQSQEQAESARLWQRYGRQMLLPELGEAGQRRLQESRVLVVGLGGLGSAATLYLAAAGVGQIWLSDGDKLEVSNLQRQILYSSADCGKAKGELAVRQLRQLNPQVSIQAVAALGEENWSTLLQPDGVPVDLVLDCSDNMVTRQLVNRACVALAIPLLSAAVSGWQGSLALFDFRRQSARHHGCYHCLYPTVQEPSLNCTTAGVLGPAVGMIGSLNGASLLNSRKIIRALRLTGELPDLLKSSSSRTVLVRKARPPF